MRIPSERKARGVEMFSAPSMKPTEHSVIETELQSNARPPPRPLSPPRPRSLDCCHPERPPTIFAILSNQSFSLRNDHQPSRLFFEILHPFLRRPAIQIAGGNLPAPTQTRRCRSNFLLLPRFLILAAHDRPS